MTLLAALPAADFVPLSWERSNTLPPPDDDAALDAITNEEIDRSYERRMDHLRRVEKGGLEAIRMELGICAQDALYWLRWYGWTYDPRNPLESPPLPANMPFDLCTRQIEMWKWFDYILSKRQDGCVKKSRGIGFTWEAGAYAWHKWRFVPGFKTAFASRTATEVDQIGNPDTIIEKIRMLYKALPKWMLPQGFSSNLHDKQRLIVNPENGNVIRGEGGDEIGRGGRSTLFFLDEAAKLEHADRVDAATSANATVRIWGSTINPHNENNLFARKYSSFPADRVFRFHYSEHPIWTEERINNKKADVSPEIWASEFEIDDSYTVEDITIPGAWVQACIKLSDLCAKRYAEEIEKGEGNARKYLLEARAHGTGGGDVGGGKAQSVVIGRFGAVVARPNAWTDPDTIDTALKMLDYCSDLRLSPRPSDTFLPRIRYLRYDSVAIGQGVSATMKRNPRPGLVVTGVNTGEPASETKWPDGEYAHEKFFNAKAEGWWTLRERCKRSWEMVQHILGNDGGIYHVPDDCLALPNDPNDVHLQRLIIQMSQVKWNRRENGKIQIESKDSLKRRQIPSPDYADALVLTCTGSNKAEKWAEFSKVRV